MKTVRTCSQCQDELASEATACWNCGSPAETGTQHSTTGRGAMALFWIGSLLFIAAVVGGLALMIPLML
jgi:hypothetical protein